MYNYKNYKYLFIYLMITHHNLELLLLLLVYLLSLFFSYAVEVDSELALCAFSFSACNLLRGALIKNEHNKANTKVHKIIDKSKNMSPFDLLSVKAVYPKPAVPAKMWAIAHKNPVTVGSPIGYEVSQVHSVTVGIIGIMKNPKTKAGNTIKAKTPVFNKNPNDTKAAQEPIIQIITVLLYL